MTSRILWFLGMVGLCFPSAYADRGSIPHRPMKIFEPTQQAIIAWDGKTEILLLSTNMFAEEEVDVLEVIPFPAEPKVKAGNIKSFEEAIKIINKKTTLEKDGVFRGAMKGPGDAAEVTFHKKIGAHDVSVVNVKDSAHFVEWVTDYLRKAGIQEPKIDQRFEQIIKSYLKDDYRWFVFDSVKLAKETRTLEPLQYTFKTDHVFYPLRISTLEEGETTVDLIVLTQKLLSKFPALPVERVKLRHEPVKVTREEIKQIGTDFSDLLSKHKECFLRIWRCEGKISEFDRDLLASE